MVDLDTDLIILAVIMGISPPTHWHFNLIPAFPADKTVLAVLGNHDIGAKHQIIVPDILDAMRAKNIIPWSMKPTSSPEGKRLAVCGPDDKRCGRPDFEPLIAASQDADFVLLSPFPDLIPDAYAADFAFHLALCGHTHGGQLVFFGRTLHSSSIYKDRYRSGWYQENGVDIRVSNGVGTSILPMRIGPVPEIHHIGLRAKA